MKHRNTFRKLGRTSSHRWAMLRTMVSQLINHERIETTVPKVILVKARVLLDSYLDRVQAKELRRVADNMIQLGKNGSLHARRQAAAVVRGDEALHKLFTAMALRYRDRAGGYTRVLPTRIRTNDAAPMAYIEFVDRPDELRQANPATTPPPPRTPLPPWEVARKLRHWVQQESPESSSVKLG